MIKLLLKYLVSYRVNVRNTQNTFQHNRHVEITLRVHCELNISPMIDIIDM